MGVFVVAWFIDHCFSVYIPALNQSTLETYSLPLMCADGLFWVLKRSYARLVTSAAKPNPDSEHITNPILNPTTDPIK